MVEDVTIKGQHKGSCADGNVLYLDCITVNILIITLYYNFTRSYH